MKARKLILNSILLLALFALAFYLAKQAPESETISSLVRNHGYWGIFLVSLISGFNLAVPVPAIAFLPLFLEAGLSYWATIAVVTLGVSMADSIAFLLARTGKVLVSERWGKKAFQTLEKWREMYRVAPLVALFIFASLAPLPNEVMLVPLGLMGYKYRHILPVILLGNLAFEILYSKGILEVYQSL